MRDTNILSTTCSLNVTHLGVKLSYLSSLVLSVLPGSVVWYLSSIGKFSHIVSEGKVTQSCSTLCDPQDCSPPGFSVPWNSLSKNTGVGCHSLLQGNLPHPGIEPRSPVLQADSLPSELPGKSKNTGVGSLSLLQGIFLTQVLNWGLLYCRWILYQLSYQRTPSKL